MTKAELIRKISSRAGVPDSEAKVFFEIFLKKASDLLSPGEAVFVKGFGHFQLRKGKIRANIPDSEIAEKDSVFVELMVYYPTKLREEDVKEEIVFNVPVLQFENYNPLDSHFSPSLGKPIIPIKGVSSQDLFIPLTGLELRKLVEGRVNRLLAEVEIVKEYTKGNEVLIINTNSIKSHQLEFNWGEVPSKNISDSKLTARSKDVDEETTDIPAEGISWDFGEDISKEIEEDSILDVDKVEPSIIEEQFKEEVVGDNADWNFGITMGDDNLSEPEEKYENIEEQYDKSEDYIKSSKDDSEYLDYEFEEEPDVEGRFERVRSFSSYFENDDESMRPDPSSYRNLRKSDTISLEEYEPDTLVNRDYKEEHSDDIEDDSQTEKFEKVIDLQNESEQDIIQQRNGINDDINISSATFSKQVEDSVGDGKNEVTGEPFIKDNYFARRKERESYYSRKGASPVFIIALIVIIGIAVALYFYLNHAFVTSKNPDPKQLNQSKTIGPGPVKKDNSVPVTQSDKNDVAETKQDEGSNSQNTNENKTPVNNNASLPLSFDNLPPQVDTTKLNDTITLSGDSYTVQVSSWQSKSIADQQAAKFKSKGYETFIEKAEIPGKGTWFRVKVKNFKSLREAEDFLLNNQ